MIVIRFGKWSSEAGQKWVWKRIYFKGYKWTPFCRRYKRYVKGRKIDD